MQTDAFFEWLVGFDSYIGKNHHRRVVLLLDNASYHGSTDTLSELDHVKFDFLLQDALHDCSF